MMAASLWKICPISLCGSFNPAVCIAVRNGHHLRGKPPGIAQSLDQKLTERSYKDPDLYFRVDIGFPPQRQNKSKQFEERLKIIKAQRQNPAIEKLARSKQLLIDLEEANIKSLSNEGAVRVKTIADHYGVFEHLFGDAYFYPRVHLNVTYNIESGLLPIYHGNIVKPSDAKDKPTVSYESDENTFWSIILTNPDGHLTKSDSEYVHWFVGNIPGSNIEKGETLVEYLQPFPPKGTGYHRHIFVLYKHEKKLDLSKFKRNGTCLNLEERTFSTYDFYKDHQDNITPAGLAFFQSDYDKSLKDFYHDVLNMREPIFEYDFPLHHQKKQKFFPLKEAFNLYMDRYRDPKQINKEFLMRKFKHVHPFKESPPPLPYPNAQYFDGYIPSWLKNEMRKSRLGWGRINEFK